MSKSFINTIFFLAIIFASSNVSACKVAGAKVTQIFQWSDGHIFISVDKPNDCGCTLGYRFAFHKNDDEKFFSSAALTALAGGHTVELRGDPSCAIHGNTPKLIELYINSNN